MPMTVSSRYFASGRRSLRAQGHSWLHASRGHSRQRPDSRSLREMKAVVPSEDITRTNLIKIFASRIAHFREYFRDSISHIATLSPVNGELEPKTNADNQSGPRCY